jgi:hypothetical protein
MSVVGEVVDIVVHHNSLVVVVEVVVDTVDTVDIDDIEDIGKNIVVEVLRVEVVVVAVLVDKDKEVVTGRLDQTGKMIGKVYNMDTALDGRIHR